MCGLRLQGPAARASDGVFSSVFTVSAVRPWACVALELGQDDLGRALLAGLGFSADLQVCAGLEEARVAVFLHQGVDFGLGQVEAGVSGVLHVLPGKGFGRVVEVHL